MPRSLLTPRANAVNTDGIFDSRSSSGNFDTCFVTVESPVEISLYLAGVDPLDKTTRVTIQCSAGWSETLSMAPSKVSGYINARLGDGWSLKGSFITAGDYTVHVYSTAVLQ